jgi:ribosomal protein S18 acetylase RimI-like enzyme
VRDLLDDMAGELPASTAFPTQRELCELFGVSRSTLRRAQKALDGASQLTGRPRVARKDPWSGPGVRLRVAELDDASLLAGVFVAAWRDAYPGIVSDESLRRLDEAEIAPWLSRLIGSRETTTVVAEDDNGGGPVGFCRFGADPDEPSFGHVFSLYVSPDASRRGIGRRLLAHALGELARCQLEPVTLWVFEENEVARAFYAAFGFVAVGTRRVEPEYGAEELRLVRSERAVP